MELKFLRIHMEEELFMASFRVKGESNSLENFLCWFLYFNAKQVDLVKTVIPERVFYPEIKTQLKTLYDDLKFPGVLRYTEYDDPKYLGEQDFKDCAYCKFKPIEVEEPYK